MSDQIHRDLSRRERQIMDILYEHGASSAADVRGLMPAPPSYSAVRAMLRVLGDKGHIGHQQDGPRYVYRPLVAREEARRSALQHLVRTFFDGSREAVVAALLSEGSGDLDEQDLDRLSKLVELARHQEAQS